MWVNGVFTSNGLIAKVTLPILVKKILTVQITDIDSSEAKKKFYSYGYNELDKSNITVVRSMEDPINDSISLYITALIK